MWLRICIVVLLMFSLLSCAGGGARSRASAETLSEIKSTLADSVVQLDADQAAVMPPQEISDALMPEYNSPLANASAASIEERFDVTVDRMFSRQFFMGLVRGTATNLVVHPDVKGYISLNLKNVTIDEVLEVTRDVYGYEYQRNRAGYFILPAKMRSKIFNVGYLNVERKGESNTKVSSGQLVFGGGQSSGDSNRNNSNNNNSSSKNRGSGEVLASSQVSTKSKADFWSDIASTVKMIIGGGDGRSVIANPQSGLIVVRAMPNELRDVEEFLDNAQLNLNRQVIIEAKVIEVQLNDAFQAGVNWAKLDEDSSRTNFGTQLLFNGKTAALLDSSDGFDGGGLGGDDEGFRNMLALGTVSDDFAYIISLLDTQGDVNVLSSPRVSTVNNQKAVIKVGSDEYFVTGISSTTTTGTSTSTTPEIELTPFFSGIALDVIPHVNENDDVVLHIHPSISEVTDQVKDIEVFGVNQSLPLAFSTVRESDSVVRAKSGQVIIIGGLMQNQTTEIEGGVPGLKSIPVLGHLFKNRKQVAKRSELVILLKPTVIGVDGKIWRREIEKVSSRVNQIKP